MTIETQQSETNQELESVTAEAENALYGKESETTSEETTEQVAASEDTQETEVTEQADNKQEEETEEAKTDETEEIKYEIKLGEESLLDSSYVEETIAFAKENNLTNEQAQKVLARQEASIQKFLENQAVAQEQQLNDWRDEVVNDTVMGGENLGKTVEQARRVVERFGNEGFINILKETGYGDNPEVVRFLSKIGNMMSEDSLILPGARGEKKSTTELFYGSN